MNLWLLVWIWRIIGGHGIAPLWLFVVVVAALLAITGGPLVLLWPRSRRWALRSRLHEVAARNEQNLRRKATHELDEALRSLGIAKQLLLPGDTDERHKLTELVTRLEVARDAVATGWAPVGVNTRGLDSGDKVDRLRTCEEVRRLCDGVAAEARQGSRPDPGELAEMKRLVGDIDFGRLVLS